MQQCRSCGSMNRDVASFCAACGRALSAQVSARRCKCGTPYAPGARYCKACGASLVPVADGGGPNRGGSGRKLVDALGEFGKVAADAATAGVKRSTEKLKEVQDSTSRPSSRPGARAVQNIHLGAHISAGAMAFSLLLPWIDLSWVGRVTYLGAIDLAFKALRGAGNFLGSDDKTQALLILFMMLVPLAAVIEAIGASLQWPTCTHRAAGIIGIAWTVALYLYLSNASSWIPLTNFLGGGVSVFLLGSIGAAVFSGHGRSNR